MNAKPVFGAVWSGRASALLRTFVAAACESAEFRRALQNEPAVALRQWQWECADAPTSLHPPSGALSVTIDDASLWGPPEWRTEPDKTMLRQSQLRLLLAGAKPLVLMHGDERNLTALANWARQRGYFTLLGPHQFLPQQDSCKGGYSNRMASVSSAHAGSGAWRGLLISPDEQTVLMAWLCLLFGWENFLGRLLGYPRCCCEAFEDRWPVASSFHEGDMGLMLLSQSGPGAEKGIRKLDWTTNIFARYFGWEAIQHFPCSWDCAATASLARRYFSILSHYWPRDMQQIWGYLSSPLLVTVSHGYALFPGGKLVSGKSGPSLIYNPGLPQMVGMEDALAKEIMSSSSMTMGKNGGWGIAGSEVSGWLLTFGADRPIIEEACI
jgi:hypothetical protein